LSELINEVRASLEAEGRMVVAIRCDGVDITGGDFEQAMVKPVRDYARIDLYTGSARDLVEDALDQAEGLLASSEGDRQAAIDCLGAGKTSEAVAALSRCMQVWHQVHQGIANSLAILEMDPAALKVNEVTIPDLLQTTRDRLFQVKDAIEARDYVLLSDTLQYEFDEVIGAWKATITAIRDQM
jgi:hypothetical protein